MSAPSIPTRPVEVGYWERAAGEWPVRIVEPAKPSAGLVAAMAVGCAILSVLFAGAVRLIVGPMSWEAWGVALATIPTFLFWRAGRAPT